MVKSVLGVAHQGLRDWFIQRVTAVVLAVYSVGLISYFFIHSGVDFDSWHALFAHPAMKIATILFFVSLLFHAWVGMWTVFTDYIKDAWLSVTLNVLMFFALAAYFLWACQILWGFS
jgi:succinate dehydrogenase / fumarate reductase membrane anchor subunit